MTTAEILDRAAAAKPLMSLVGTEEKNEALLLMARSLRDGTEAILAANALDMQAAEGKMSPVMLDRLRLDAGRIASMAEGIEQVAALPDPVGQVLDESERPNGLKLTKIRVPMGVISIIYESRPNVTADAAALAIKAGSAVVLRSGKEAHRSAEAIVKAMRMGLARSSVPADALELVEDTSRDSATELMRARGRVDLLIPRGGKNLIRSCVDNALVPVLETGTGICHIFVDESADEAMALNIISNAKTSRPSVCNAEEVLLVHEKRLQDFLPKLYDALVTERAAKGQQPVELRLDGPALEVLLAARPGGRFVPAGCEDFDTEFLDYILAVGTVTDCRAAAEHINAHSTGHSEAIITGDEAHAAHFCRFVDSACVYVNASTRFTDGGEFGFGCEMGISTQKMHARGPLGLPELCSFKYLIRGNGQIR